MILKTTSITHIINQFWQTLKRFPLSVTVALIGTILAFISVDTNSSDEQEYLIRGMLACALALPSLIAVKTFIEAKKGSTLLKWGLKALIVLLSLSFYWQFENVDSYSYPVTFLLLSLAAHLLVSFAPWLGGSIAGFWQYNKVVLLKILSALLFSAVLYIGLSIALLAVDQLFDVKINSKTYVRLFVITLGFFNTLFFLSFLPKGFEELKQEESYPKALKIFTQYILMPLVFVYLLILYGYMGKIIINGEWPVGWVSILVLCFSVTGIFSFLLIFPLRNNENHKWIRNFNRWFYIALLPLTGMLFVAIYKRIHQYGLTEERYFVLLLAIWLVAIIVYFLLSKKDDIRVIPISLFLLTVFASFTAFSFARQSQLNRFENILTRNEMFEAGKVIKAKSSPPEEEVREISAILEFLNEREDLSYLQPYLSFELDSLATDNKQHKWKRQAILYGIMEGMGLTYSTKREYKRAGNKIINHNFHSNYGAEYDVSAYDLMLPYNTYNYREGAYEINLFESKLSIKKEDKNIEVDLNSYLKKLVKSNPSSPGGVQLDEIKIDTENADLKVRIFFQDIAFITYVGKDEVEGISGSAFVLIKEK